MSRAHIPSPSEFATLFTAEKTIEDHSLNLVGAQPLRAALARLLYRIRPGSRDPLMAELAAGVLVIEDFLVPAEFAAVEREAEEFMSLSRPTWIVHNGTTEVCRHSLDQIDPELFPALAQWRTNQRVAELASSAERRAYPRHREGGALVERLTLGDSSEPDEDAQLHIDTFFDTHKIWLYLDDVTAANAALVYVPGSHRLDRVRLRYEYRESVTRNRKSRRVGEDEVRSRGLQRRVISCRHNTLVVANTCGYHCRSVGETGASRRSLHREYRYNPFRMRSA